jgi:VWFA-related protein
MRLPENFASWLVLVICSLAGAVLPASGPALVPALDQAGTQNQRPGPPGTYRVRVQLIPIDVIVTDARGRPVTDLKQEDFLVFENGSLQQIRHFVVQALTSVAQAPILPEAAAPGRPTELVPQSARIFLIMMGRGRFQTPFKNVDALIRFIRSELLPQDRVAVFAYNRATAFSTDHERIAQVLERYKRIHEKIESWLELRMSGLAAIYGSKEIPASFQAEIDKIFAPLAGTDSLRPIPGQLRDAATMDKDARTVAEQAIIPDANPSRDQFTKLEADAITDLSFEEYASTYAATHQDVQNIFTCIQYMRFMEGEKHLFFFSPDGLFLPRLEQDESLASMANDARVAIDTFQTGGLSPNFSWSRTFAVSSLRNVSQFTGGRAAINQDIGKALTWVNETTRFEYLLGYYSQNENWDGKYRRITVKVNRPGVNVSYRHGYYARETLQLYNREEFLAYSRISAAAAYSRDLADIAFKISTSAGADLLGPPKIRVELQIDAGKLGFQEVDGFHTGKLYTAVFYADDKGKVLDSVWGFLELKLPEDKYQAVMKSGITLPIMVPHKVLRQILKVVICDSGSGLVGSKVTKMR